MYHDQDCCEQVYVESINGDLEDLIGSPIVLAEVVDDSNKRPLKTVLCVLKKCGDKSFNEGQFKSLEAFKRMVRENGASVFSSLEEVAAHLNA